MIEAIQRKAVLRYAIVGHDQRFGPQRIITFKFYFHLAGVCVIRVFHKLNDSHCLITN